MKYILAVLITLSFIFVWNKAFGETIVTNNLLSNSTFTGGNTGWTNHGTTQQHHVGMGNECAGSAIDNSNSGCGVSGSFAGVDNGGVSQTITLSEKTNMTKAEINNGFTSTMKNDIWFWHGQDSVTMKQELTDSANNTTTQTRIVTDSHNNYQTYTDTATIGTNTSTDYSIKVSIDIDDSSNLSSHAGPDVDNVELKVSYTYINPLEEEAQEIIDDINEDIADTIDDIDWEEEEYTWDDSWQDDYSWEEEYTWEDDFYFEDEYVMEENVYFEEFEMEEFDMGEFEQPPMFEEFEEIDFEEMPTMEEVFFENEYMEPPMMTEELFTEEFEEDFTDFIAETGMEEEFMEFLEEEGITAEEFFEEITEEEFDDEFTEESFEEFEEPMEEITANEESIPEVIDSEEEGIETEITESEEQEVAQDESTEESQDVQEEESDSEGTEESEVQTADSEEQDTVQSEGRDDVDTDTGVATDVARVESKLKQNLKKIAKQIAQVTKQNTQNLSKEDIFFKDNNTLDAYKKIAFYSVKEIYKDASMGLFLQLDLSPYTGDIYLGTNLNTYQENDPIEIQRVKLLNIESAKRKLLAELEALRQ